VSLNESLIGRSFLGSQRGALQGATFQAVNPATGELLEPLYVSATPSEVDAAVQLAAEAFSKFSQTTGEARSAFLRKIADGLDAIQPVLAERAHLETALPMPRLMGEVGRTSGQLRLFASVIEEGSWVQARIDTALPTRQPLPRPDIRAMLRPLGPVAVFGASNFPLAFSTAGGDTASALAAGCPVIFKAHPAHPGTSELVAGAIQQAVASCGLPAGVFSMLYDNGIEVGAALVRHPLLQAVAFTGSLRAGRALMDIAAARPRPIPCFAEMSSGNPVFVLPSALSGNEEKAAILANSIFGSFTLGAGQFCTKPGIILLPDQPETSNFVTALCNLVSQAKPFTLLTSEIARQYTSATKTRSEQASLSARALQPLAADAGCQAEAKVFTASLADFVECPSLSEEIFGPDTLLVQCAAPEDFLRVAHALDGHLTATLLGSEEDLAAHRELISILEQKAGRLIFNAFPTGVEVSHAMVHGGPYPATSDARFTSVGSQAIFRFVRPVCFQGFPDSMLPPELRAANPLVIHRLVDGVDVVDGTNQQI
jgi:NADP-dependent aldehyde dehydrogenase